MESLGPREVLLTSQIHSHSNLTSWITCATFGPGETIYLGTSDGQIEEHRLVQSPAGQRLKLVARRSISKKVGLLPQNFDFASAYSWSKPLNFQESRHSAFSSISGVKRSHMICYATRNVWKCLRSCPWSFKQAPMTFSSCLFESLQRVWKCSTRSRNSWRIVQSTLLKYILNSCNEGSLFE